MNLGGNTCITDDGSGDFHILHIVNGNSPEYLKAELPQPKVYNYNLRSEGVFERSHVRTQRFGNTFLPYCIREWNELHVSI